VQNRAITLARPLRASLSHRVTVRVFRDTTVVLVDGRVVMSGTCRETALVRVRRRRWPRRVRQHRRIRPVRVPPRPPPAVRPFRPRDGQAAHTVTSRRDSEQAVRVTGPSLARPPALARRGTVTGWVAGLISLAVAGVLAGFAAEPQCPAPADRQLPWRSAARHQRACVLRPACAGRPHVTRLDGDQRITVQRGRCGLERCPRRHQPERAVQQRQRLGRVPRHYPPRGFR